MAIGVVDPQTGLGGDPTAVRPFGTAGGTDVSVVTMGLGLDSVDAHIDRIVSLAGQLSLV